jgi:hypothetical protein
MRATSASSHAFGICGRNPAFDFDWDWSAAVPARITPPKRHALMKLPGESTLPPALPYDYRAILRPPRETTVPMANNKGGLREKCSARPSGGRGRKTQPQQQILLTGLSDHRCVNCRTSAPETGCRARSVLGRTSALMRSGDGLAISGNG